VVRASRLFVGIGNMLKGDDGVGVYVAQRLADLSLPGDVEVYEAGTSGLELAAVLEERTKVVVVDAIDAGKEPGAVFRLTPEQLRPLRSESMSLHQAHLLDALEETALLDRAPAEVIILAVQVERVVTEIGLSPSMEQALPRILELSSKELELPAEIIKQTTATPSWR
jgi:hydrogenase maturation protease